MSDSDGKSSGFPPDFFAFLRELSRNNNREWFSKNKARYESSLKEPSLRFIREMGTRLRTISTNLVADPRPVGGSMMRIYRDIRFSRDKSPYRTSVGIHFPHRAGVDSISHVPGFFLHLEPGASFVASGMWRPEPDPLAKIRKSIVAHAPEWKRLRAGLPELEGESLKRPPPGWDPRHPLIEDIKRKDFITSTPIPDSTVTRPGFEPKFVSLCKSLDPLNRFLARAIDQSW
jgi:uncharacterized protein (TIGR02453 family)